MTAVAAIVEGDGEVPALPILLRWINEWRTPDIHVQVLHPIRVHRDRFLNRDEEFRRHLLLAAAKRRSQDGALRNPGAPDGAHKRCHTRSSISLGGDPGFRKATIRATFVRLVKICGNIRSWLITAAIMCRAARIFSP